MIILTRPVNLPLGGDQSAEEITTFGGALTKPFHVRPVVRIELTMSEVKGASPDDCSTEAPYILVHDDTC